jgi:hypothetical protein
VRKLTVFVLATVLIASSSVAMAKQHKIPHKPAYGSAVAVEPGLLPEAVRMREMQKTGPTSLCATTAGTEFVLAIWVPGGGEICEPLTSTPRIRCCNCGSAGRGSLAAPLNGCDAGRFCSADVAQERPEKY